MKRQMRFRYNGSWTRWFGDDEDISLLAAVSIEAVEISEEMTREEFKEQFPEHPMAE